MPLAAYITGEITRFDVAESVVLSILDSPSGFPSVQHAARIGLAMMAVQRGDAMSAGNLYIALESLMGTMSPQGPFGPGMSADRVLGLLSQTMGTLDQACRHFEDALVFCRKATYRPELAWTCCDYADTLLQRNGDGDRVKAASLLNESLEISTELGMRPLIERLTERLERVQAQHSVSPAHPGGLTQREVEVLRLIAEGKTNLEIAEELVIAEGTARRHVANIYEKIGAANRIEAASYATREALLPEDDQTFPA